MSVVDLRKDGRVGILTITRPESMNALGADGDGIAFRDVCDAINADLDLSCIVLTGQGRAFSAGGDLKAMADPESAFTAKTLVVRRHYQQNIHRIVRAIFSIDVPVIAAVNGPAIGLGCDIACLADIRIASDKAKFGATFLKIGLVPGDGGSWLLPRAIGMSRAAELLFTGSIIDADTAERWGLVNRVVESNALLEVAMEMAGQIAALPPHALRLTKALLREGRSGSYDASLDAAVLAQVASHGTDDHREGIAALLAGRSPSFTGN